MLVVLLCYFCSDNKTNLQSNTSHVLWFCNLGKVHIRSEYCNGRFEQEQEQQHTSRNAVKSKVYRACRCHSFAGIKTKNTFFTSWQQQRRLVLTETIACRKKNYKMVQGYFLYYMWKFPLHQKYIRTKENRTLIKTRVSITCVSVWFFLILLRN